MAEERVQRKLVAILAADVVGYSRLIRADEEGALSALNSLRKDIVDPKVAEHHGGIVKPMGDRMLAEFPSVVDADSRRRLCGTGAAFGTGTAFGTRTAFAPHFGHGAVASVIAISQASRSGRPAAWR